MTDTGGFGNGRHVPGAGRFLTGALFVAAAYAAAVSATDVIEAVLSDENALAALRDALPVSIAGGILIGLTLGLIASRMPGSRRRQFLVWWVLVYLSTVGVIIEGAVFAPDLVPVAAIPLALLSYAVVAGVVAGAVALAFAPRGVPGATLPSLPDRRRLLVGLVAGTVTYAVLYFVFGALNYALVTGPYYEQQIGGLVNPPFRVVVAVFLIRGVLLTVSLIPLVRTVDGPRRRAWMSALSVAVLAGFLPLLIQVGQLPLVVLAASSYEIALQVGPTAIVVAAILGTDASPSVRTELRRMWRGDDGATSR